VLITHSYGAVVCSSFLAWVDQINPTWVAGHLDAYVNIAGSLLGVPKIVPPLLSGTRLFLATVSSKAVCIPALHCTALHCQQLAVMSSNVAGGRWQC
jgi:phospholipid:diacylglycerol acyltransferase